MVAAGTVGLPACASAIVYRNDMTDAQSRGLSNQDQFNATGKVDNGSGTGTLILSDWVVTAKHVTGGDANGTTAGNFIIGGVTYTGQVYANAANDFSLLHLTSGSVPTSVATPIAPGFFGGESGKLVWLVGFGGHETVANQGSVKYDGLLRAGTNVVREYQNPFVYYDNANTNATSSIYESSTAPGDSGGPMYQQVNNVWYVVGETFGAGSQGFIHTPTNPNKSFILDTIRTVTNDATFNFATPAVGPTALAWDADATVDGTSDGAGTWDAQRPNFRSAATGFNYQWENAVGNDVTFGNASGAAGTVTIVATNVSSGTLIAGGAGPSFTASGVSAHNVTFNAAGSGNYTIAGAASLTLVSNGSTDPTIAAAVDATISAPIVSAAATITKTGVGRLTLSGTNTYSGNLLVNGGAIQATTPAALPGYASAGRVQLGLSGGLTLNVGGNGWTSANVAALTAAATFTSGLPFAGVSTLGLDTTNADFAYANALPTNVNLDKRGPNVLTLTAAQSYVGTTYLTQGTLALAGAGRLPGNALVQFATGTSTLQLGSGVTQSVSNLRAFSAGNVTAVVSGPGTLQLAGTALGSGSNVVFDLSALGAFVFNQPANALNVNGTSSTTKLAQSSKITASALNVGTGNDLASTNTNTNVVLGAVTTLAVDAVQVGNYHANGSVAFGVGGGTAVLRGLTPLIVDGADASRVATVTVGFDSAGAQNQSGTLDVSNGTLDARVGTLTVGTYQPGTGSATATGTFSMGNGTLDATAIVVGLSRAASNNGAAGTTVGTFNQNAGNVVAGTLTLGQVGNAAQGASVVTSTYNLGASATSATLAAGSIVAGVNTTTNANTTATRTINVVNGRITTTDASSDLTISGLTGGGAAGDNRTLNLVLAAAGTHAFTAPAGRTITVSASVRLGGGGDLLADGAGTVQLNATSAMTGSAIVRDGTLRLGAAAQTAVLSTGGGADVQGGRLTFDYAGGTSTAASVRSLLAASYATGFAAGQLRSTTATSAVGLGYGDDGVAVTLLRTFYGDATLDNAVTIADFNALAGNFGATAAAWSAGDFNYDGSVTIADFNLLAGNFGATAATPNASMASFAALAGFALAHDDAAGFFAATGYDARAVPEPASLAAIALAGAGLRRRRRFEETRR